MTSGYIRAYTVVCLSVQYRYTVRYINTPVLYITGPYPNYETAT